MRSLHNDPLRIPLTGILFLLWSGTAALGSDRVLPHPQEVSTGVSKGPHRRPFVSPESCGKCHPRIYSSWKRGMHRFSFEDPIFQAAYSATYLETAGESAKICLRCHAPAAFAAGDLAVADPIHRKGVQCDFCHSVESLKTETTKFPWGLFSGDTVGAPRPVALIPEAHGVKHQPLLNEPRFCAGCHEYVVESGAHIMSTWSEWKASPYPKEGKTCQNCHMPAMGWIVGEDGNIKRINEHDLSRGRTSKKVAESAELRIKKISRDGDQLTVHVQVENVGSGHCLPTGMPSRRVTLEVEIHSGGRMIDQQFRVYQKVVGDASGRKLHLDADIKLRGRKILSDNRLRPREPRDEVFTFTVDPRSRFKVRTALNYSYAPLLLKKQSMKITISEQWR